MMETEGDTLTNTLASDHGNYSDGLRKSFHNEPVSFLRRTNYEYVEVVNPKLSVLLSGTPGQVKKLIPDAENGLFSRFMYYHLPMKHQWNDVFADSTGVSLDEKHYYEVDFLLSRGAKLCPVEVKSSGYKAHASLDAFCLKYSSRIKDRFLIYTKDLAREEETLAIFCNFVENKFVVMEQNKIILYQDDNEITRVAVRFADEDLWLTQNQLAEIYDTTKQNISLHIENILKDGELDPIRTVKDFLTVRQEGNRQVQRNIVHYNLDMIIALGYRVQSQVAVRFRRWATQRLHEYIQKGFAMDDERLKQGGNRYFRELLQRIRDIRSSERNFYQQVTDIYATAVDYDPRSDMTKTFFATVQNKLHYAVHENTAAEVIYNRVDNEKPFVGMTNFKGNYVTKDDVKIAKNYLSELELQRLNLLVSGFLDFAEFQALEMNPMTMKDWIEALDSQITAHKRKALIGKGAVSHAQAIQKAEQEFEIYRQREMEMLESDFDREVKKLKEKN